MRVVVAVDKFKGSLDAAATAAAVADGVRSALPDAEVRVVPVADGGDGTLEAAVAAGFEAVSVRVDGPLGEPVVTAWARRGPAAVVELADACGLLRLSRGPDASTGLTASSRGVGQAARAALDAEVDELVVGLGGSASTDGGASLLAALGVRLLTADGRPIGSGVEGLESLAGVDASGLHPALAPGATRLVLASDVEHVLLGEQGAAAVFGPQKGLDAAGVERADRGLSRLVELAGPSPGAKPGGGAAHELPGAGAAGGVGWALLWLGAEQRSGIEEVLGWSRAPELFADADLVITGEGRTDEQTLGGKAPLGVARAVAAVPGRRPAVGLVAGQVAVDAAALAAVGIDEAIALTELQPDPARCMADAAPLLTAATARLVGRLVPGR